MVEGPQLGRYGVLSPFLHNKNLVDEGDERDRAKERSKAETTKVKEIRKNDLQLARAIRPESISVNGCSA